jgi:hypothetical protein
VIPRLSDKEGECPALPHPCEKGWDWIGHLGRVGWLKSKYHIFGSIMNDSEHWSEIGINIGKKIDPVFERLISTIEHSERCLP